MRNSRTDQDPTSDPSEASDAAEAILGAMRPSAPTPSGRRRPASGQSPPRVGEGRGQSNSPEIGGPTPPIPQPRPGALPLRPAIPGGPTPGKAGACARYRSESGALPRRHKRAGGPTPAAELRRSFATRSRNGGPYPLRSEERGGPTPLRSAPALRPAAKQPPPRRPRKASRHARKPAANGNSPGPSPQPPALRAWQVRMRTRLPPRRLRRRRSGFPFAPTARSAALLAGDRVSPLRFLTLFPLRASPLPLRGRPLP